MITLVYVAARPTTYSDNKYQKLGRVQQPFTMAVAEKARKVIDCVQQPAQLLLLGSKGRDRLRTPALRVTLLVKQMKR